MIAVVWDAADLLLASNVPKQKIVLEGSSNESREDHLLDVLMRIDDEKPVLITSSDRMISFIARNREALGRKFSFNIPDPALIETLNDKKLETRRVAELGFALPETIQDLPEDPDALAQQLRFPILFKPADYAAKTLFPAKNAQVRNRVELRRFYASHARALHVLLAQEVIPGPDGFSWVASCTFDGDHNMLDCGIKQKIRMKPPHFGGSTFAISANNPEVYQLTRQLGKALGFVGHAGIEFRWDQRDQTYKYIECNPRMPENVEFDEYCGLATVWNSYLVAQGHHPEETPREQREGVIFLDLRSDAGARLSDGESITAIVASYLKYASHRRKGQTFAFDDPMPGLTVAWRILIALKNRVLSRLAPRPAGEYS